MIGLSRHSNICLSEGRGGSGGCLWRGKCWTSSVMNNSNSSSYGLSRTANFVDCTSNSGLLFGNDSGFGGGWFGGSEETG